MCSQWKVDMPQEKEEEIPATGLGVNCSAVDNQLYQLCISGYGKH